MNALRDIDSSLVLRSSNDILKVILYRDKRFSPCMNKRIIIATIKYKQNSQRFELINTVLFITFLSFFICLFVFLDLNVIFLALMFMKKQ